MNKSMPTRWTPAHIDCAAAAIAGAMLLLFLGGCATAPPAPVEQIKYFSQAFAAVNTVGQPLLDDLAIAERFVGKQQAESRAKAPPDDKPCSSKEATWAASGDGKGYIDGFCLEHVGYFSTLGDPPATTQLRGGLRVIERYAEVLTTLAEGRNIEQALGEVEALGQEVGGLLALTGASVAIAPALTALRPLLASVARNANADEARRLIVQGAPQVNALLGGLRDAVPAIFKNLTADPRRRADKAESAEAAVKDIEARRVVVAQYVVLLGRLQQAWDATVVAANNPGGSRLADLVARSAQLRADAEAVRRTLAALRSGAAPAP